MNKLQQYLNKENPSVDDFANMFNNEQLPPVDNIEQPQDAEVITDPMVASEPQIQAPIVEAPAAPTPIDPQDQLLQEYKKLMKQSQEDMNSARERDDNSKYMDRMLQAGAMANKALASQGGYNVDVAKPISVESDFAKRVKDDAASRLKSLVEQSKLAKSDVKQLNDLDKAKIDTEKAKAKLYDKKSSAEDKVAKSNFQAEREKLTAKRYEEIKNQIPSVKSQIKEAQELVSKLKKDDFTGVGAKTWSNVEALGWNKGRAALKQKLDSLSEKSARAALKAAGDTRPTDADVEGAKKATFNLSDQPTENINRLNDFIKQQESILNEYKQMDQTLKSGSGLEDFIMKEEGSAKDFPRQVKRGNQIATVSNNKELEEAISEGFR